MGPGAQGTTVIYCKPEQTTKCISFLSIKSKMLLDCHCSSGSSDPITFANKSLVHHSKINTLAGPRTALLLAFPSTPDNITRARQRTQLCETQGFISRAAMDTHSQPTSPLHNTANKQLLGKPPEITACLQNFKKLSWGSYRPEHTAQLSTATTGFIALWCFKLKD